MGAALMESRMASIPKVSPIIPMSMYSTIFTIRRAWDMVLTSLGSIMCERFEMGAVIVGLKLIPTLCRRSDANDIPYLVPLAIFT